MDTIELGRKNEGNLGAEEKVRDKKRQKGKMNETASQTEKAKIFWFQFELCPHNTCYITRYEASTIGCLSFLVSFKNREREKESKLDPSSNNSINC